MSNEHHNDSHSLSPDIQDIERSMATIVQASFSLLFKQLLDSETPNHHHTNFEPSGHSAAQIGDFGGSDFKRLAEKSRINRGISRKNDSKEPTRPVTRPQMPEPARQNQHSLTDMLFGHEDRYFRNDRSELSKDIFPSDCFDSSQSTTVFIRYGPGNNNVTHTKHTSFLDGTEDEVFHGMGLARMWKMFFG